MLRAPGGAVMVGGEPGVMVLNPSGHGGHFVPLNGSPVPVPVLAAPLEPVIKRSISNHPIVTPTAPQTMTLWSGGASVGVLKPVVGASATLAPAQTVKTATPPAPLKPVVTQSKTVQPAAPSGPEGVEQRALPRPDSVPSLSWITVALFAAAGLAGYLAYRHFA